ncbi:MAG: hypothetical protein ACFFAH_11535 [Promethearchaeota archaeon]
MIIKPRYKRQIKCVLMLSIILMMSFSALIFPVDFSNLPEKLKNERANSDEIDYPDEPIENIETPKSSALGNVSWWNTNWNYRRLIKVNNPYSVNFTDYGVSINFNYAELGSKIQSDLDDIRIVENGVARNYYVVKDYPVEGNASVWFDTNITKFKTDSDTYMYFGNPSIGADMADGEDETMGWVKNGDFELDPSSASEFIPYGWNFTHDPVDEIKGDDIYVKDAVDNTANFVNKLINNPQGAERCPQGTYAYKWGSPAFLLSETIPSDYAGTFYSYPFKVPIVEGGGIELLLWQNVRTYTFRRSSSSPDYDGYFLRLCNGTAENYKYDPDDHIDLTWIETYGGEAHGEAIWLDPQIVSRTELREHYHQGTPIDTKSDTAADGDLTGDLYVDLTNFEGKEIFLEQGAWGDETKYVYNYWFWSDESEKSAFFQLDNIRFNYTEITTSIEEPQHWTSDIHLRIKDVDGRLIPNTKVYLKNNSEIKDWGTATYGIIDFNNKLNGWYNISVTYTLGSSEEEIFNSGQSGDGPYYWNGINYTLDIICDIWTIDFEVVDWDGYPLGQPERSMGYISIAEDKAQLLAGNELLNLSLNSEGKATFRWRNASKYYYRIYYKNAYYESGFSPEPLNESYIYRSDYISTEKQYEYIFDVNKTNTAAPGSKTYAVSERIYTSGSKTDFISKKIIKANITLSNMDDYLTDVAVYYIDKDNSTGFSTENRIYFKDDYTVSDYSDIIQLDLMAVDNAKLKSENYQVYGLLVEVNGKNFTINCNGQIKINTIETCFIYNKTALARINIELRQKTATGIVPAFGKVKVLDNETGQDIINLTASSNTNSIALDAPDDTGLPFWYLIGKVYNFSIDSGGYTNMNFNVTDPFYDPGGQWRPTENYPGIDEYNFTLYGNSSIIFIIIPKGGEDPTLFDTVLLNESGELEGFWGVNLTFSVNFSKTEDGGNTWVGITPASDPGAYVYLSIYLKNELLIIERLNHLGNGNYSINFNSSRLSAGYSLEVYSFKISGFHPTIDSPSPKSFTVKVKSIPTGRTVHNYEDNYALNANRFFEVVYQKYINISIRYYILADDRLLDDAILTYSWLGLGPYVINQDPTNPDYFTFLLDSGDAPGIGYQTISITAYYENYTSQVFDISIYIKRRPTLLNNENNPLSKDWQLWVKEPKNYHFTYTDADTGEILDEAFDYSYDWYVEGEWVDDGDLIRNTDGTYTLDFDTETREVGVYTIKVELEQVNYEDQDLEIRLEIMLRTFDADLDATNLEDDIATVVQGDDIELEVTLWDESRNEPLTGAIVTLDIEGDDYEFDEDEPGVYILTYETDDIEAFFTSKTMSGEITIEKADFVSEDIEITFVITMEEIFPGMPTFYFIMVVGAIAAIVGSLVGYRIIQFARIPQFVKKTRGMKKAIKANSLISESLLSDSKQELLFKLLGDDWDKIGLSLEDVLGFKSRKKGGKI